MLKIVNKNNRKHEYDYIYKPYLFGEEFIFNFDYTTNGRCSQCNRKTEIKTTTLKGIHNRIYKTEPLPRTISFCNLHYGDGMTLIQENRFRIIYTILKQFNMHIYVIIMSYLESTKKN